MLWCLNKKKDFKKIVLMKTSNLFISKWNNGKLIFLAFLILHLLPLFSVDVLLTLDGSSHLYNAKLFNEILSGNETLTEFYKINSELVPNYLGHLLLSFFLKISTPIIALKLLHVLYVIGLAVAFRNLVLAINPKAGLITIIIFPFIYSGLFIAGFYNFSIAIIFLFITIRYWIVNIERNDFTFYFSLTVLFFLTYLSHSFTFAISCFSIGIITIMKVIESNKFYEIYHYGKKAFIPALPSIVLSVLFVLKREAEYGYINTVDLWKNAIGMWCFSVFDADEKFLPLWFSLVVLSLVIFIKTTGRNKQGFAFLYLTIISFILYFYMPDSVGYASVFSQRILLIGLLFWALWIATQNHNKYLVWGSVVILFLFQHKRLNDMSEWSIHRNNKAKEMLEVAVLIPKNSIIKPIRKLAIWDYYHLSNLLGAVKPQVILENYEATHDYFPIEWKINLEAKIKKNDNCYFETVIDNKTYKVDYLVVFGHGETDIACEKQQIKYAEQNFEKTYKSDFITVYKVVD